MDLNKLSEKLKAQKNVGVTKDGQLTIADPHNNGLRASSQGLTTLHPEKFYS